VLLCLFPRKTNVAPNLDVVRHGLPLTFFERVLGDSASGENSDSYGSMGKLAHASIVGRFEVTEVKIDRTTDKYVFMDGQESHFKGGALAQDFVFVVAIAVGAGYLVERRKRITPINTEEHNMA